jgi:DNA polymerase-1
MKGLRAWDTETTTKTLNKRLASPFHPENWVVTHAFEVEGKPTEYWFGKQRPGPGWLKPVLEGARLLAGHNIKFDLLHALQDKENLEAWMEFVAGGGMVWDTQLAEYLLNGMGPREHMLTLDEVAPRYGGNLKVDEVKVLWAAGVDTADIEPALLSRYLIGGPDENGDFQEGDIGNTRRIALGQLARAKEAGQLRSVFLNMGSLICSIEMERNGMFVDMPLALHLAEELRKKIDIVRLELEKFLPEDLPFEFKWTSPIQKSALIFGGTVSYDRREYLLTTGEYTFEEGHPDQAYSQMDVVMCEAAENYRGNEGAGDLMPVDAARTLGIRVVRYASGKNTGEIKTKKVKCPDLSKPKSRMGKDTYTLPGFTWAERKWESSTPGVYSTASDVIEELGKRGIPFLTVMAELQTMTKDLSTYYIVTDPETGKSKGMLALVDEHGLIHHRINHTNTVTGRFSSSDPNLQNISKGSYDELTGKQKGSQIKRTFVSRFGADGVICQSDFTALEVYVQAILTRCEQLILDLRAGLDMHCVRVSQKEGMPYDEVLKLCKGYKAEDGTWVDADPEWDKKRTKAKVFSFQRAYGAGAKKIAESTGMPLEEVEALILAESTRYPEIDLYYEQITEQIKANRQPSGTVITHPEVRGVTCHIGKSHYRTPDGKLYEYTEQPSPEYLVKRGIFTSFSPTEIKNYVVQGGGGEWAKAAMYLAVRSFYARKNFGHKALLVNQVHDALYGDFHNSVKREAAALLHACMEAASDYMEYFFSWNVPVPVPSDTTWGKSMMDEGRIATVRDDAKPYRDELRALYMGNYKPSFEQAQQ